MGCSVISLCVLVGSTIGSLIPLLWGGSGLSLSSVLLGGLGGLIGVWVGVKLSDL
jgi:hypothetical protein